MCKRIASANMRIGLFIAQLDTQIVSSSLNKIDGGLSTGKDEMAQLQTSYLTTEIIVIPLFGWLLRVFPTRWFLTLPVGIFALMNIACGLVRNTQIMIFLRALQGVTGVPMIPLAFTTAFIYCQGRELGLAVAAVSAPVSLSPTLEPTLGGWITDNLDWRWLFYIGILPDIYLVLSIPFLANFDKPDLSLLKVIDYPNIILLATTLGCLGYTPKEGARQGQPNDNTILLTSVLTSMSFISSVTRMLKISNSIAGLHVFKDKYLTLGCFFFFSEGVGVFSTVYLTPVFLGQARGLNAEEIGFVVCTTGIFQLSSVPFYFRLSRKINPQWLLMVGLGGFIFSMYLSIPITHEWEWQELLFPQAIRGISQQFAIAPIVTLMLGGISKGRLKLTSDVFNLTCNLGGASGVALCGSISNSRTNFHFSRMGEKMVFVPHTMDDFISRGTLSSNRGGSDQISEILASTKLLDQLMPREAQIMAFSDTLLLINGLLSIAFLLVPAVNKSS